MAEIIKPLPQLVEAQPTFPAIDLTEASTPMVELVLANADIVEQGRQLAEDGDVPSPLVYLRMADWPIVTDEPRRAAAFQHGISMYQTLGRLLQAPPTPNSLPLWRASLYGEDGLMTSPAPILDEYRARAVVHLSMALPRTYNVITAAAERPYPGLGAYAVSGAAVAYEFEKYARGFAKAIENPEPETKIYD